MYAYSLRVGSPALIGLVLLSLAAGCGDDDGRSYETACDSACARMHDCNSNVDMAACAEDCKEDAADIGPKLSDDFLAGIDSCVSQLNCVDLGVASVSQTCQREAAARLAPGAEAEKLCKAVVDSIAMCSGLTVGMAGCLDAAKIFNDSTLISARGCASMPCDQRPACLVRELGTDPSGGMME